VNGDALTQLLEHFGSTQLVGFILVVARVTPLFIFAPMFSSKMLPGQARAVIAMGISLGLTPVALASQQLPSDFMHIAGLVLESLLVGFAFAFTVGVLFAAVETAGSLVDIFSGFSFASEVNPFTGTSEGPFGQLYGMLGAMIFLVIGGDAWVMRGLARTFTLVPLGDSARLGPLVAIAEQAVSGLLAASVEVAAPVLLAIMITDVAFGVVSRVVPQLNVFAVGFPMKVGVALLTVSVSLPFIGGWISDQLGESVASALTAMHVM
jgi:flagellar biosynthetic protein FliR